MGYVVVNRPSIQVACAVVLAFGLAIAGSGIKPEGTVVGGGIVLAVGFAIAPGAAMDSLISGIPFGLFHGLVGCAFE